MHEMGLWIKVFLWKIFLIQLVAGQECPLDSSGTVGRTNRLRGSARDQNQFYINRGDPATCSGVITSFSFCYHRPQVSANEYIATFAVYRPDGGLAYTAVSQTFTIQQPRSKIIMDTFTCSTLMLDQLVPIEAGYVLGACVVDPSGTLGRLDLASARPSGSANANGDLLRVESGLSVCDGTSVPANIDFNTISGDITSTRVLHLWATIEAIPPTTVATTTTEAATTQATPGDTIRTTMAMTIEDNVDTTTVNAQTTDTTTDDLSGGGVSSSLNPVTIAVPVVIVMIVLAAILVTAIILVTWRQRKTKQPYPVAIDNQLYAATQESRSAPPVAKKPSHRQVPQSQEHVYEFQEGYVPNKFSGYTYADVGPFGEQNVYDSPLDAPAISYAKLLEKNKEEDIYGGENPYEVPAEREESIYDQLKAWGVRHIRNEEFKVTGHLGSGQFGSVEQGVWKRQGTKPVDVALKSLTKTSHEDKVKFLQEAAIMAQFRHPNVITLHGMVTRGNPMMIMVELAKKGDLREFLLSIRPDPGELMPTSTAKMFLKFSQQVALGMQYLSAKGFVHRDLAARNVLVTSSNILKVADFGLSRDLADENYYVSHGTDKIPVKWTAPEAIHYKKYSTASDVWAYGCLLYEIWSVGHKPFEGVTNVEAIREVDSGKRLSPPAGCPKMIYQLMILSWHPEKQLRLAFRDIVLTLVDSEEMVLNIPEEDSSTNPLAGVLGAPLEAGENMYSELQRRYIDFYHGPDAQTDDDYF